MLVKVNNIKMPITCTQEEVFDAAVRRLGVHKNDIKSVKILRRSIDARRGTVQFVYSLLAETCCKVSCDGKAIQPFVPKQEEALVQGTEPLFHRPVILGFGPAGMFCALTLARHGYRPIVLERGADVTARTREVSDFFSGCDFSETTNVQFGEGGAGTFSDGKLTTRIGDALCDAVLRDFVSFGAPEDILYHAMPHIGTDILRHVVKRLREEVILLGGEVRFLSAADDIVIKNGRITEVVTKDGERILCDALVAAIGHSARDTYEMFYRRGVTMVQKPFSVGFRAEHLRADIDRAMYGAYAGHPALGAAPYQVSYREEQGGTARGCYSFCMCPGGTVILASSEAGTVVTNGMSERARDNINSNSAICVNVAGADFKSAHPLAGVLFQRDLEKRAFLLGGGDYKAPVQRLGDYVDGRVSKRYGRVLPSIARGTRFADLNDLFSQEFNAFMKRGLLSFEQKIKGFADADTLLTGVETRTSAPVRILRTETGESVSVKGLFPAGEGAGYAGGIMSAAVDGIRTAQRIIKAYAPQE